MSIGVKFIVEAEFNGVKQDIMIVPINRTKSIRFNNCPIKL